MKRAAIIPVEMIPTINPMIIAPERLAIASYNATDKMCLFGIPIALKMNKIYLSSVLLP